MHFPELSIHFQTFSRKLICKVVRGQIHQLFLEGEASCLMNLVAKVSSNSNPSSNLEFQKMNKNPSPLLLQDQKSLGAGAIPPIRREKAQPVSLQIILPGMASRPGPHNLIPLLNQFSVESRNDRILSIFYFLSAQPTSAG